MSDGGYDAGYKKCNSFWGTTPGSLILKLDEEFKYYHGKSILDIGCGEAKNTIYFAEKNCYVDAYDISEFAIVNAKKVCSKHDTINLKQADAIDIPYPENKYDVIIAYGLFHCFNNKKAVDYVINSCLKSLKSNGLFILCAFNDREHELSAHQEFNPLLLKHSDYIDYFNSNTIVFESDENLYETHPHNNIPHMHSMTRLIIRK